jgi:hypothetical protein
MLPPLHNACVWAIEALEVSRFCMWRSSCACVHACTPGLMRFGQPHFCPLLPRTPPVATLPTATAQHRAAGRTAQQRTSVYGSVKTSRKPSQESSNELASSSRPSCGLILASRLLSSRCGRMCTHSRRQQLHRRTNFRSGSVKPQN